MMFISVYYLQKYTIVIYNHSFFNNMTILKESSVFCVIQQTVEVQTASKVAEHSLVYVNAVID